MGANGEIFTRYRDGDGGRRVLHNAFDNEFITFLNIQCDCITLGNGWCEVNEIVMG